MTLPCPRVGPLNDFDRADAGHESGTRQRPACGDGRVRAGRRSGTCPCESPLGAEAVRQYTAGRANNISATDQENVNILTKVGYDRRMPTESSRAFRRFTRAVFDAQAAVLRHGDTANAPIGQSSARWRVLRAIDDGHTSVAAAARFMGSSRQSVQRLADAMIDDGLLEAEGPDEDRRLRPLRLTAEGQRVHDALEENFDMWADRLLAHIRSDDLSTVSQRLEQITYIVNADREYLLRTEEQPPEERSGRPATTSTEREEQGHQHARMP